MMSFLLIIREYWKILMSCDGSKYAEIVYSLCIIYMYLCKNRKQRKIPFRSILPHLSLFSLFKTYYYLIIKKYSFYFRLLSQSVLKL